MDAAARTRVGVAVILLLATAESGSSQALPNSSPKRAPYDTSAWKPLTTYIVQQLAPYIARAASDTVSEPWIISLPKGYSGAESFERHLRTMLKARIRTSLDDHFYTLTLDSLVIEGDTLHAKLESGFRQLCTAPTVRHGGYHNSERIYLFRFRVGDFSAWSAVKSKGVFHGDMFGCR